MKLAGIVFAGALIIIGTSRSVAQVAPVEYRTFVETLAQPQWRGRGSGERGNEAAARFVAGVFQKAGLKPLRKNFLQPFTFAYGLSSGKNNRLTVNGTRYRAGIDFTPWALSSSGAFSGSLALGLDGDVSGKVVLLRPESGDFRSIAGLVAQAREKKAVAALFVRKDSSASGLGDADPASADAGIPVLQVSSLVAQGFKIGQSVTLSADVRHEKRTTANIIGLREGTDPVLKHEVVVIGAHMDHLGMGGISSLDPSRKPAIHPGADDNASGTAAVLGLAKSLPPTKRSVLFICFSGEERGLLGSQFYVNNPLIPLEKTVAMLNLDMVGRLKNNKLSALGVGTGDVWPAYLDDVNLSAKFQLSRDEGSFGGSDHQSFAAKSVPVLFFFTGLHEDYHRPSDTPDKIDADGIARIASLTGMLAQKIADAPTRPTFQQVAVASPGRTRARASLGSIPEYGTSVVGVLLGGVRPGSPAEKAGLQAGDVIVKLGGKTVRNIEEYTALLGDLSPGDTVEIVVQRAGKEVTVKATLAESKR